MLEFGCGHGAFGAELVRIGNSVVGIDPDPAVPVNAGFKDVIRADFEQGLAEFTVTQASSSIAFSCSTFSSIFASPLTSSNQRKRYWRREVS